MHELVVPLDADDPDIVTGLELGRAECGCFDGRIVDQRRVVGNDSEVVQRVQLLDLGLDLERARECHGDVADRDWHRVAVNNDQAALGIDDQSCTVVVPVGNAGQGVGQVERDYDQRRGYGSNAWIVIFLEFGMADLGFSRRRPRGEVAARPDATGIVALAASCRKPYAVHLERPHDAVLRVVHRYIANLLAFTVSKHIERRLEIVDIADRHATHFRDHRAARYRSL